MPEYGPWYSIAELEAANSPYEDHEEQVSEMSNQRLPEGWKWLYEGEALECPHGHEMEPDGASYDGCVSPLATPRPYISQHDERYAQDTSRLEVVESQPLPYEYGE